MGVASGCGEQEVGVASGSGWNLWVWLLGVVLRRYIDFFILLIIDPYSSCFCSSILLFVHFLNVFRSLQYIIYLFIVMYMYVHMYIPPICVAIVTVIKLYNTVMCCYGNGNIKM